MKEKFPDLFPIYTPSSFPRQNLSANIFGYNEDEQLDDYEFWDEYLDDDYRGRGHYIVCSLSVKNVPDDMNAHQLYEILHGKMFLDDIIDVKIHQKDSQYIGNKKYIQMEMEEQIKKENCFSSMIRSLEQDKHFNGGDGLNDLFSKLDREASCFKLRFNQDDPENYHYKLDQKSMSKKIKNSTYVRAGLDFTDCDNFIPALWRLHEGKQDNSSIKSGTNQKGYQRNKQKSAIVTVLGWTRCLRYWFQNKKWIEKNSTLYVDYLEGKKKMSLHKSNKYKKAKNRIELQCEKIEFGIFDPKNPTIFYPDFDVSRIRKDKKGMHLYFFSNQKPTDKIQILFEVPELNKFAKVEFPYLQCQKVYVQKDPQNNQLINIFFQLASSPCYFISGYNDEYYQCLSFCQNWERMPHFGININDDYLLKIFKTQNPVIKITLPWMNWKLISFLKILASAGVAVEEDFPIGSSPSNNLLSSPYFNYNILLQSKLSFESKYALLSCLTQEQISLFQITLQYFRRIELEDSLVVEKTLKDIAKKSPLTHPEEMRELKEHFEKFFWELFKENEISKPLWEKSIEFEKVSNTKRVTITPTLTYYYIEEPEQSNSVLRRYKAQEKNFLRVTFEDETGGSINNVKYISNTKFRKFLNKLLILDRSYKFLAYSSSQLKNSSLWMISEQGNFTVQNIHAEIGDLSQIHNPAKRAARLGQLFSASFKGLILNENITTHEIVDIKDPTQKYTFTDGVGKISKNLLNEIKLNQKIKGIISAIQVRCGGVKGILVSDPTLPSNHIYFRNSMIKFKFSSYDSNLEILDYSKYRPGYLNRQIILLLLSNGLDSQVFKDLQDENIRDLEKKDNGEGNIFFYINNEHHLSPTKDLLQSCMDYGIDITREPFVKAVLETVKIRSFINLKEKSNILVKKSARLTGVIDEHQLLNYGQIYLCVSPSNGEKHDFQHIKSDKVIITKNPCLHPGDIRILEAVDTPILRERFKHLVNVVVFPSKGPRPHTDEIAGSDLDGDMYFVSWDPRLIPPYVSEPMSYEAKKLDDCEAGVEEIIDFFIEFMNNDMLGKIDNSHLARADCSEDLAYDPKCLIFAELHAIAVDYAKSGVSPSFADKEFELARCSPNQKCDWIGPKIWPDYMEKDPELTYDSDIILGRLYRLICSKIETCGIQYRLVNGLNSQIEIDIQMIENGFENYLGEACLALDEYYKEMFNIFKIYEIKTEYEIFSGNYIKFMTTQGNKKKYNLEKIQQKLISHIQYMKEKLSQNLLEDLTKIEDFKDEQGNFTKDLCQRVSAIYLVSYYNSPENCPNERVNQAMYECEWIKILKEIRRKYQNIQLIGLPWFFFKDVLLYIKEKKSKI